MNTYEVVLICMCCAAQQSLGTVQAQDAFEAKDKAACKWPNASEEEMYVFLVTESTRSLAQSN